jgi:hypothetical protein
MLIFFSELPSILFFSRKKKTPSVLSIDLPRGQGTGRAEKGHPFLVLELAFYLGVDASKTRVPG